MDKINITGHYFRNLSFKAENKGLGINYGDSTNVQNVWKSDISSVSGVYGMSLVNKNKKIPQMSLKNLIQWLESQGKVEGKDFETDSSFTGGNTVVTIKDKKGREEITIHYNNGCRDNWSGYEVSEYNNGKLYKVTSRDCDGNIDSITRIFDKNAVEADPLLKNGLTYDTTPDEYIKYLKDNNIDYSVEYSGEEDNNRSINFDICDKNHNTRRHVWYYYGKNKFNEHCSDVSISDINEQGRVYRRIVFDKDSISIITYV